MSTTQEALEPEAQSYLENGDNTSFSIEGQAETVHIEQNLLQLDDAGGQAEDDDEDEEEVDGDEEEEEEVSEQCLLAWIEQAKSLVVLSERVSRKKKTLSPVWKVCKIVNIREVELFQELLRLDKQAYHKLNNANNEGKELCICETCYDDKTIPLYKCLIAPSYKNGKIDGTGNMTKHIKSTHPGVLGHLKANRNSAPSNNNITPAKNSSNSVRSQTPVTVAATSTGNASLPSSLAFPGFTKFSNKGQTAVVDQLHFLIHKFATNNNISERAIARPTECPEFKELIEYAVNNGHMLKKCGRISLGRAKFQAIRRDTYQTILGAVAWYAELARDHLTKILKKKTPFVTVAHDIWDSKKKEVLGVTVFFCCPPKKLRLKVPIGLTVVDDKTSSKTAELTMKMLNACGINAEDLYKAANDTTNSALKVGRILTGGDEGTCAMHQTQLVVDHATGRKKRSAQNTITDDFPACEELRKKAEKASQYLMNAKSKGRFLGYKTMMEARARTGLRITLPNSTRAAGVILHYEAILKSCWNLRLYWMDEPEAPKITEHDMNLLSEFYSVLYPLMKLVLQVQTDTFGSIAYTYYFIYRTFALYTYQRHWWVVETRLSRHPESLTHWNADAKWPIRNFAGNPIVEKGTKLGTEIEGDMSSISMTKVKTDDLLEPTNVLISRIIKEFPSYGATPIDDRLLAMACNPFTATVLMNDLGMQWELCNEYAADQFKDIGKGIKEKAMDLLAKEIRIICSEIIPSSDSAAANSGDADDDEDEIEDMVTARRRKRFKLSNDEASTTDDPVQSEVERFFNQQFDVRTVLLGQTNNHVPAPTANKVGATPVEWVENVEKVAKHFDVMDWWLQTGHKVYPLIYPVACCILALPDSNGDQERTFSAATWMDGKLSTKQNDITFQMKVLACKNSEFLKEHKDHVEEHYLKAAAERTKKLLIESVEDADSDNEGEALLAAFDDDNDGST